MRIRTSRKEKAHPVKIDARRPSTLTFAPPARTGFAKTYPLGSGRRPQRSTPNLPVPGSPMGGTTNLHPPHSDQGHFSSANTASIQSRSKLEPDKSSHRTMRNDSPFASASSPLRKGEKPLDEQAANHVERVSSHSWLDVRDDEAPAWMRRRGRVAESHAWEQLPGDSLRFNHAVIDRRPVLGYRKFSSFTPTNIDSSFDVSYLPTDEIDTKPNQTVDPLQKAPDIVDDLLSQWTTLKLDAIHNSF